MEITWLNVFFYLLCFATFITVAIFVYAGQQTTLIKRQFGNVYIKKNLQLDGTLSNFDTLVRPDEADYTFPLDINEYKLFIPETTTSVAVWNLPNAEVVSQLFPERKQGATINLGRFINMTSGSVNLNFSGTDDYVFSASANYSASTATIVQYGVVNFTFVWDTTNSSGQQIIIWTPNY